MEKIRNETIRRKMNLKILNKKQKKNVDSTAMSCDFRMITQLKKL
jgi:hypothetical protein